MKRFLGTMALFGLTGCEVTAEAPYGRCDTATSRTVGPDEPTALGESWTELSVGILDVHTGARIAGSAVLDLDLPSAAITLASADGTIVTRDVHATTPGSCAAVEAPVTATLVLGDDTFPCESSLVRVFAPDQWEAGFVCAPAMAADHPVRTAWQAWLDAQGDGDATFAGIGAKLQGGQLDLGVVGSLPDGGVRGAIGMYALDAP
jgi:hypothetical protein